MQVCAADNRCWGARMSCKTITESQRDARRIQNVAAALMICLHVVLVAVSATRMSPVADEPAHLVAGVSHFTFGEFDLYRVNPPLVRLVATWPLQFFDAEYAWELRNPQSGQRYESRLAKAFLTSNGQYAIELLILCRWAVIPFTILGACVCRHWATELYGRRSGVAATALWCFSPNILAHAGFITPDLGASSLAVLAGYSFWQWQRTLRLSTTITAGLTLGAAFLCKTTLLILAPIWTLLFCLQIPGDLKPHGVKRCVTTTGLFVLMMTLAGVVLNSGFGFRDTFHTLADIQFFSQRVCGEHGILNGIQSLSTQLTHVPIPLPADFIRGLDLQWADLENDRWSYLRGTWQADGFPYFYLYGLLIKVPLGTILICGLALKSYSSQQQRKGIHVELIFPAVITSILLLVGLHEGFTRHLRYVLPILPFAFVWMSRVFAAPIHRHTRILSALFLAWSATETLTVYPNHLGYFNELIGGCQNGPLHMLDSNVDWGQDLIALKDWIEINPHPRPLYIDYSGISRPQDLGITCRTLDIGTFPTNTQVDKKDDLIWLAVSVQYLFGRDAAYELLRDRRPDAHIGCSIRIFRVNRSEINAAMAVRLQARSVEVVSGIPTRGRIVPSLLHRTQHRFDRHKSVHTYRSDSSPDLKHNLHSHWL